VAFKEERQIKVGAARLNLAPAILLFAAVAIAPLPFGSTGTVFSAFWCVVLGIGLVMASPRALGRKQIAALGIIALVVVIGGIVLHEQLATPSQHWTEVPSPRVWLDSAGLLSVRLDPTVSIARNQPFFALGAPLAAILSASLSLVVCSDRRRARQLLKVIAWSGLAYAAYGIVSFLVDPSKVLWRAKLGHTTVLTSTFLNRNTAAVYFGSVALIWLLALCENAREHLPPGKIVWRTIPEYLLREPRRAVIVPFAMLFICTSAMFTTNSRAGVVLSLGAFIVAFIMYFFRDLPHRVARLATIAVGILGAILLLQVMGAGVTGRFDDLGISGGGRLEVYRSTIQMILEHPWLGTGLGTFVWAYPAYRGDHQISGVWDRAHSTLLELAAELGVPFATLVAVVWIIAVAVLMSATIGPRRPRIVLVAALLISLLAVVHSLVDFSLQIPGLSIMVFAVAGAGIAQSFNESVISRK
jgi:O-antigen ligase